MARLAFRIFDPETKKFHYSGATPTMLAGYFERTATLETVHNMKHEQFIGINSVNGKAIYDGDIVEYLDFYEAGEEEFTNRGVVVCEDGYFSVTNRETNDEMLCDMDLVVIGNINQNPELLEVK